MNSIKKIIENCSKNKSAFYNKLNEKFLNNDNLILDEKILSKEESEYFDNYIKTIGNGNRESQIKYLSSVENYLDEKVKVVTEEDKKYRKLYVKLGFLIGLALFIVLI